MSAYGYDDRGSQRHRSHRTREREPEYMNETTYIERGSGQPMRDLVYRPRDDDVEDIPRDFAPPGASRSSRGGPRSSRYVDDDYYSDHGHARDRGPPRSRRDDGYYSDERERPRRERRKSVGDQLKEAAEGFGLGGVVGAIAGKSGGRDRSRSRHRGGDDRYDRRDRRRGDYSSSRSRSKSRSRGKWEQAAKAAVVAGAAEAFRSRKTPGPWTGEKGQRIATAALGAAGIDGFLDRDPDKGEKRHLAESAIGGLLANRLAHGSRSRSRGRNQSYSRSPSDSPPRGGRSRSRSIFGRSRSRGRDSSKGGGNAVRNLAGAGAFAAAGKALYDRVRSKSRARKTRSRSRSASSEDSYVPSRGRRYDKQSDSGNYNNERSLTGPAAGGALATTDNNKKRDSGSDSESSTDIENRRKKTRTREILTAGFATIATIHAAHGVYNSMVASENRRKLVSEGDMAPEEARKLKSKNMLQDAAAVGIAALGVKGAFSEWKEMNEHRQAVHELADRKRKKKKMQERRQREAQNGGGNQNMYPMGYPAPQPGYPAYADGNPYGAGGLPPPPIGSAPPPRY